jgi:hypothetical protein
MMMTRTVLLAAFSTLILSTPAFAAPGDHKTGDAPCDADGGAFDQGYDPVAFRPDHNSFSQDQQALPGDDQQAAPDADAEDDGDSADDPDADDGDEDAAPGNDGCAQIMVTPYDIMIHQPDRAPEWAALRRRVPVRWARTTA